MINFGIIGCGLISVVHAAAINNIPEAKWTACCDVDEDKGQRFAEANHCRYYQDYKALLADPQVDVVTIATPHYLHAEMTIAALAAGKHVVCEKPMAIDAPSAGAVAAAVNASDRVYAVCYQNRFNPSMVQLKASMASGQFGTLQGLRCSLTWHRDSAYYAAADWKGTWAKEGGGVLINQAIHTLDAVCWLAGRPQRVFGKIMTATLASSIEVEDTAMAVAMLPHEVPVVIAATNDFVADPDPSIDLTFKHADVHLTASQLLVNQVAQPLPHEAASVGKAYWGMGHERMLQAIIHRINQQADALDDHIASLDAQDSLAMVLGIYRSSRQGGWQSLTEGCE